MDFYCLVLTANVYRVGYGTKYCGFPVVRYLYVSVKVLKMIL